MDDLQRRRILLAIHCEPNLIFAGHGLRAISSAAPERRPRHLGSSFIAHVPDKAVQPGFRGQPTLGGPRPKTFIVARVRSRLLFRRVFADDLAFLVQNLQSDWSTLCAFTTFTGPRLGLRRHRRVRWMSLPWL